MSILVNSDTKVVVQGITGSEGTFHSEQMIEYGTNIVAGVTPGKGGETVLDNIPVYNSVKEARDHHGARVLDSKVREAARESRRVPARAHAHVVHEHRVPGV